MNLPHRRDDFLELLRVQVAAEWEISDFDCVVDGELVSCRYQQSDMFLRRLGLALTGDHGDRDRRLLSLLCVGEGGKEGLSQPSFAAPRFSVSKFSALRPHSHYPCRLCGYRGPRPGLRSDERSDAQLDAAGSISPGNETSLLRGLSGRSPPWHCQRPLTTPYSIRGQEPLSCCSGW